jgi:hypothetical protein
MAYPQQTYATIQLLLSYINTDWITNGEELITGVTGNNVVNALANFIVSYTLNSGQAGISTSTGVISLSKPITVFTVTPASIGWPDNVQNEYYIVNATGNPIPLTAGYSYTDTFLTTQTVIPSRTVIHIAKATNNMWVQVNNSVDTSPGVLPGQSGQNGRVLFTSGNSAFWGDQILQLTGSDPNWTNANTWINGSSYTNANFNSPHFCLFWNDASRYLLQNLSPPEWQYEVGGFQVLIPGFNASLLNVNLFLIFKGTA